MEALVTLVALLLGGIIVLHESVREPKRSQIDFLMMASVLYFVCYCVIPIYLQTLQDTELGFWNWIFRLPFNRDEYYFASLLSLGGYLALIAGYHVTEITQAKTVRNLLSNDTRFLPETFQVVIAVSFGLVGIGSLFVYANEVGGFEIMVKAVGFFRNQTEAYSDFGFLIKVAPFTCISSYVFWGLLASARGKAKKGCYGTGFGTMFMLSLLILYSLGGRVQFVFYLLTFVLYVSFRRGKLPLPHVFLASVLFLLVVLFGKEITNLNVYVSDDLVGAAWEEVSTDPLSGIRKVLLEFSFPFINLANIMELVPEAMGYRWFGDIPLGIAYLLPKPLLGLTLPPTVIMVYDEYVDVPMPIDLLSFGYLSMGIIGTIIVYICFGTVLCLADLYLPAHGHRTMILFRAAWLLYLSAQVMYGSPQHALVAGFPLLIGTLVILGCRKLFTCESAAFAKRNPLLSGPI